MAQVQRYETIRAAIEGRFTGKEAAQVLGLSRRQVERLKAKVRAHGASGVRHGNAGRTPWNKTPDALRQRIIDLATGEYAAYNFSHLADTLAEGRHIHRSDETLRRWLRPLGHGRPLRRARWRGRVCPREASGGACRGTSMRNVARRCADVWRRRAGKAAYRRRAPLVEGTFGVVKSVLGVRQFLMRGLRHVKTEWLWVCTAVNLRKVIGALRAGTAVAAP